MASGLILDPLVLLRMTPLVSTTASFVFALDQTRFLGMFNKPGVRRDSRVVIPSYWTYFFPRGIGIVFSLVGVSAWSGAANVWPGARIGAALVGSVGVGLGLFADGDRVAASALAPTSAKLYLAASSFALAHLCFVPLIVDSCKALLESGRAASDPNACLDEWLRVHWWRTWTVDLAAVVSAALAVASTLRA